MTHAAELQRQRRCRVTQQFAKFVLALGILLILFWLRISNALDQKLQTVGHLTVFDADGKRVGAVMDASNLSSSGFAVEADVAFKVGQVPFVLNVYRDGFSTGALVLPPVAWESSDCSGKPFLGRFTEGAPGFAPSGGSMPLVAVGFPGNTVYVEDGATQTVTIGSFSTPTVAVLAFSQPVSTCLNTGFPVGSEAVLFPARALINMNDEFRPPFAVKQHEQESND
jgi:hypothetical protein